MVKILNIHAPSAAILLVVADILVAYVSISVGLYISYAPNDLLYNLSINHFIVEKSVFVVGLFIGFFAVGVYYRRFLTDMKLGLLALAISHLLALSQLALVFYLLPEYRIWISALAPALGLSLIAILATHVCFDRLVGVKLFQRKVVVLGSGPLAEKIQESIERSPYLDCSACLLANNGVPDGTFEQDGSPRPLFEFVKMAGADEIVVALADRRARVPTTELLDCRAQGIKVSEFSSFIERIEGRVELDNLKPSWMIYADGFAGTLPIQRNLKRLIDAGLGLVFLILTLPIVLAAGLAVILESPGPMFYRQTRVGLGGRHFRLWKLRSMRNDAEADGIARWAQQGDARVTRVGALLRRLRIDELPQLYNIVKGDMSFVGPRPERPEFVEHLAQEVPFYIYRHTVKPGVTGWAQLQYPYGSNFDDALEKLKYDLYYIKNGNLGLDFIVLLQTLRVIIWPNAGTRERTALSARLDLPIQPAEFLDGAP